MIKIFRTIFALPKIIRAVAAINKAWSLYYIGQYIDAEHVIEEAEKSFKKLPIQHKIFKGNIKFLLNNKADSATIFEEAWSDLEESNLNEYDKKYLMLFVYEFLRLYAEQGIFDLSKVSKIGKEDVRLERVTRKLKRRFPMRDHPDWEKHGIGYAVSDDTLH